MRATPPRVAAALLVVVTLLRMAADASWVGDWNETGSRLGVDGISGATLAGLALALHARRNLAPLRSLALRSTRARLLVLVATRAMGPSLLSWATACAGCYIVTAMVNPAPSAASPLPLLAATTGVLSTLSLGLLLGATAPVVLALPLVAVAGFLGPASLGAVEPSAAANFTISTSTSVAVPYAPVETFYHRQLAFFGVLLVGPLLVVAAHLHRARVAATAAVAVAATVATALLVAAGPASRIADPPVALSSRCQTTDQVEVCLLSDHARYLRIASDAAGRVAEALPGRAPVRYVEQGVARRPGDVVLDASGVRVDVVTETVDAAAGWQLCDDDLVVERAVWLAHRAGLLDDLPALDGLAEVRDAGDTDQLAWWSAPMDRMC